MTTPARGSSLASLAFDGSPLPREARTALLIGFAITLGVGAFSFHPGSWGVFLIAAALAAAVAFPLSGMVAIALTITVLPLVSMSGVLADIRADELLMIAVVGSVGIRALVTRSIPWNEVVVPMLAFVGVAALSMGVRIVLTDFNIRPLAVALPLAKQLLHLLSFMAVIWLGRRWRSGLPTITLALVTGGIIGALLGIAQSLWPGAEDFLVQHYPSISGDELRVFWGHRAFGAFDGNPNHLAVSMLLLALLALAISDRIGHTPSKRAWFVAALPMLFALVSSASRATYLVAAVLFLGAWLWQKRRTYLWAFVGMVGYTLLVPNLLRTRLTQLIILSGGRVSSESDVVRKLTAWANPFGQRQTLRMTDNFYLDVLVNFWPLALIAFLWLVWVVGRRLWREYRSGQGDPGFVQAALMSWIAVAVLSLNGAFFSIPRVAEILWLVVGLAWAWFAVRDATTAEAGSLDADRVT